MSSPHPAPSLRDVARVAGVSHMTVSRVVNEAVGVSDRTRERVEAAIAELGYRPNPTARALANGRARVIGVLDATGGMLYGPASTVNAIELAGREVDYSVMIAGVAQDDDASLRSALDHLLRQDVAGLVVIGPGERTQEAVARADPHVPVVSMHGSRRESSMAAQERGARDAVHHLVTLGHTRIAHIAGPADWSEAAARRAGYEAEMAALGAAPRIVQADWSAAAGYDAARMLLRERACTAVFCADDQIALGVLHAAADLGVAVPADLSVVGFDDTPESAHYVPPLTTVHQDFAAGGRRAVAAILNALGEGDGTVVSAEGMTLVVRASTAPCAEADGAPVTAADDGKDTNR